MTESPRPELPENPGCDPGATIAALRERGADRFDPVRFRFIEALAGRAGAHRGDARRVLDGRLAKALSEYGERFERARNEAGPTLAEVAERFPHAADDLARLRAGGDFSALRRLAARLENADRRTPLADLLEHLARHSPASADGAPPDDAPANGPPRAELKSIRYFRNTWARLSVDQQLTQALAQAPQNAGPLNSHLLVLRALESMRDIAPDYLNRFMSYVDALLWLDQAVGGGAPSPPARGEGEKKRKSGRLRRAG